MNKSRFRLLNLVAYLTQVGCRGKYNDFEWGLTWNIHASHQKINIQCVIDRLQLRSLIRRIGNIWSSQSEVVTILPFVYAVTSFPRGFNPSLRSSILLEKYSPSTSIRISPNSVAPSNHTNNFYITTMNHHFPTIYPTFLFEMKKSNLEDEKVQCYNILSSDTYYWHSWSRYRSELERRLVQQTHFWTLELLWSLSWNIILFPIHFITYPFNSDFYRRLSIHSRVTQNSILIWYIENFSLKNNMNSDNMNWHNHWFYHCRFFVRFSQNVFIPSCDLVSFIRDTLWKMAFIFGLFWRNGWFLCNYNCLVCGDV